MNTKIKDPLIISLEAYKNGQIHLDGVIEDIQMLMQSPAQSAPLATEGREVWVEVSVKEFKIEPLKSVVVKFRNGLLRTGYFDILGNFRYDMAGANCLVKDGTAEMNQLLVFSRTTLPSQLEGTLKQEGEKWVYREVPINPDTMPKEKGWYNISSNAHPKPCGRAFFDGENFKFTNSSATKGILEQGGKLFWLDRHLAQPVQDLSQDRIDYYENKIKMLYRTSQPLGGYTKEQVTDALKIVEYIERNNSKINNHTWKAYKEQIESHIEDLKAYLSTLTAPIPAEREGKDAVRFGKFLREHGFQTMNGIMQNMTTTELYQRYKQYLSTLK